MFFAVSRSYLGGDFLLGAGFDRRPDIAGRHIGIDDRDLVERYVGQRPSRIGLCAVLPLLTAGIHRESERPATQLSALSLPGDFTVADIGGYVQTDIILVKIRIRVERSFMVEHHRGLLSGAGAVEHTRRALLDEFPSRRGERS